MSVKPTRANPPINPVLKALAPRWQALSEREQRLLILGAAVLVAALVWWLAWAPALRTLREAPAQQAALDAQWLQLKELQAQAQTLKQQPRITPPEALRALQNSSAELLGANAQLQIVGDRCTVTLKAVPAPAFASWLARVRTQARAVPVQAQLQRNAGTDKSSPGAATWSGSVVLSLPTP